jgi:hypothetical protein
LYVVSLVLIFLRFSCFASCRVTKSFIFFPLPEGGEVEGRIVVTDDSQETSLPKSENTGSQKSTGSSEKETESGQPSDSTHFVSPPPANSPDGRGKRKRDDVEDSGTSKPAEVIAVETSAEVEGSFDPFATANAVRS